MKTNSVDLLVTLSPSMPHFKKFVFDDRIAGIRINSAMMDLSELDGELEQVKLRQSEGTANPLYYDIKGRQLRICKVIPKEDHLRIILNHKIEVKTPTTVLFKAGEDYAVLNKITQDGITGEQILHFAPGAPKFNVKTGESICIRDDSFKVFGTFPDYEIEKIKKVKAAGFNKYVLSYVESQRDIDELREYVGKDAEIVAKIESIKGLNWVKKGYKRQSNLCLMAARGDLYVEVPKPHQILNAMKTIIQADPNAIVGSRILLSCVSRSVPDAVDFSELAWLYDIGYKKMMLCDDLCLDDLKLSRAVNAFCSFKDDYANISQKDEISDNEIIKDIIRKTEKTNSTINRMRRENSSPTLLQKFAKIVFREK